ncbi:protein GAMETE EXPRESSED 1 [Dorcoceras hygrometricum]|uniref:Protein GAMETE EXPRESSED 1 n=1 Tax=Dorcoceras hygrometricum TaxID=472368 RepID=A0A2Z7CDN6_9LAMI|nr:protein GAMETE EXPRESSED 1 [Dorcoceras hygrometricum]
MGTGIDQMNLHSVHLGYLKILQVGNTDPNNTKAGKQIRGQASISPGTANLRPSLTGHGNSAAKQLKHNFKTEENTYPQAYTNRGTLGQDFTEIVERTGSSRFLKSTVPVSKLVSIGRETQEEFSATNNIQNNGGTRRKSTKECYGEQ